MRDVVSKDNGGAGNGTVPSDLSAYDELTQTVLDPYVRNDGSTPPTLLARYVAIDGASENCGLSWDAACSSVATTLAGISDASADRIYLLLIASSGDASYDAGAALTMQNHVAIVGGWDASGGWGRSGTTVLSGGGDHIVIENTYSADNPLTNTALLYGVSIEDGNTDGRGGGISNYYSSPVLTNVTIAKNSASASGGGIYNNNSSPVLTNVTIANNNSGNGGGIYNTNSSPVLTNVTIANNSINSAGGGIYNTNSSPVLTNIIIVDNSASFGGGIFNLNSSPVLINVTIANNSVNMGAVDLGGGIYNDSSFPVLINVTIANNRSGNYGIGIYNRLSSPVIVNSIIWSNTATNSGPQIYARETGNTTLAYSLLEGGVNDISSDSSVTLITAGISSVDPKLSDLTTDAGSLVATMAIGQDSSSDSSAKDFGVYVRRHIDPSGDTYYYSTNEIDWYTDFTSDTDTSPDGLAGRADPPTDSIDLTATDATGKAREARPDAGAYEYISEAP